MIATIGQRIEELRKDNGLSQQELAHEIGITRQLLSMIEIDKRLPTIDVLNKLSERLNVSVYTLLTGYDDSNALIANDLNLSNDALNVLKTQKDSSVPVILSQIIEHRLFVQLIRNIEILCKPQQEYNKMFTSAVILHLTDNLPYFDSPEDIQTAYRYSTIKLFENIVDSIVERKGETNETGKW